MDKRLYKLVPIVLFVVLALLMIPIETRASLCNIDNDKIYQDMTELYSQVEEYSFAQNYYNAERIFKDINSQATYDGWELEWQYCDDTFFDVLIALKRENIAVEYTYDDSLHRTAKTVNGSATYFDYDEWGNIVREYNENREVVYLYNDINPFGFIYNGVEYQYLVEQGLITGILQEGKLIARYTYDNGILDCVYQIIDDKLLENTDENFIANINRIRYTGWYCDAETGWNYSGRYFDFENDRFIDGRSRQEMNPYIEMYGYNAEIITQINDFYSDANISFYSTVPSKEEQIRAIATVLFGESYDNVTDQLGVAQVVQNRMHSSNPSVLYGGKTAYEIVTAVNKDGSKAFSAYGVFSYEQMMRHSATQLAAQAMENARRLYADTNLVYHLSCYDNYTFFCSVNSAYHSIYSQNGSLYKGGKKLKNVYLSNYGKITSTVQLKYVYGSDTAHNDKYYGKNNVFYEYED